MKILFIASDNNRTSGAFLSMVKLNELLNNKFNVQTLVILPNDGDGNELLAEANIAFEIIPSRNWIVDIVEGKTEQYEREKEIELQSNIFAINKISEIIKERKIDIVHINTSYSCVGAQAAVMSKIPFVWHIREFLEEDQNRKIWNRDKGYALMGKANILVAISDSIYNKYISIFGKDKVRKVLNGIDERVFVNEEKKVFESETVQFTIVGGLVPYKGQQELIRACGILKKRTEFKFRLNIVGKYKETYMQDITKLINENDLSREVFVLGARDDIPEILYKTDILFVCSKNEAFGRTTVEGMMSGCIVVGADTAGTKELIIDKESGFLYHHGDEKDLADVVEHIINNKEKAEEVRKEGRRRALNNYTAFRNAQEISELYKEITVAYE